VLAYEEPEPYLMKLPPRNTKLDFILTPQMMLRRWIPYIVVMTVGVLSTMRSALWLHTGFVSNSALIGTSRVGELERGLVACEYAGTFDGKRFVSDLAPFHCKCHDHWEDMEVDQWGRAHLSEKELLSKFDPWTGHSGGLYNKDVSDWSAGVDKFLKKCSDPQGILHWCWKDNIMHAPGRPLLSAKHTCAEYGTRLSGTMGYVSLQLGEIFSLMNFRTDDWLFHTMTTNKLYFAALLCNLSGLCLFLYEPSVAAALSFAPLSAKRFAIACLSPLMLVVCNEVAKALYMKNFKAEHVALRDAGEDTKAGEGSKSDCLESDGLDELAKAV